MKHSYQRDTILEIVYNSNDHPNADTIYQRVKEKIPNISLGTVYRNLNQLTSLGKIKKIVIPNGSDRFDKTLENHAHCTCCICGKTYDIESDELSKIGDVISNTIKSKILYYDMIFVIVCEEHTKRKED